MIAKDIRPGQLWLNSMGSLTFVIARYEPDPRGDPTWRTLVTFVLDDGSRFTEYARSYAIAFDDASSLISDCPEPE